MFTLDGLPIARGFWHLWRGLRAFQHGRGSIPCGLTTRRSISVTARASIRCATWCQDGTGHPGAEHPDDQWCHSDRQTVRPTRMPVLQFNEHRWLDNFRLYLARERDGSPYAHLGRDENTGAEMTLNEARELRDALTDLLTTAALA